MNANILIVEDDNYINNLIRDALEIAGYSCIQAFSGTEGILRVQTQKIDLVILDLMLPGKAGEEVIRDIKNINDIPVIVVSAKDSVDSKIELLRLGADDYLTKPFDVKELEVRVEIRLRRSLENRGRQNADHTGNDKTGQTQSTDEQQGTTDSAKTEISSDTPGSGHSQGSIFYKEIELNPDDHYVRIGSNNVELTKHEFRILELLVKNPDKAFSKQAIYDYAWDDIYLGEDKTINVHISNIRRKLKAFTDTEYIDTVWGIGFKLAR